MSAWHDRVGDLTLFEALTGGAFDRLNWQHSGEFDQNFSKKSNAPAGVCPGGGWAVLELTGTLYKHRRANISKLAQISFKLSRMRKNDNNVQEYLFGK